jgi:hypothetical protein
LKTEIDIELYERLAISVVFLTTEAEDQLDAEEIKSLKLFQREDFFININ